MEILPITTEEDIARLSEMADEIWHEYWPALIGLEQTEYMIEMFHSIPALRRDIHEKGYLYWLLKEGDEYVGYTGAHPEAETGKLFISKIYLYASERGKGYASKVIAFWEEYCRTHGLGCLYLTVNKYNALAIRAYEGKGFVKVDSVESDIGHGFIMDDYIMEKSL